ncbi:PilZ domain-containing protein [Comamonas faecalis]|uniref:Cyclic diguanosine monophosphate-binding protein n=1 Tax=Comamonas faecalis TaxID=1387849 RepID=A0ABP7QID2_9BURK
MSQERRHFVRVPFVAPALLSAATQELQVRVLDLSLKGALVQALGPVQVTAGAHCQLMVPLGGDEHIGMAVEVAHLEGDTLGLHCLDIDLDSVTHLRRLIELQLGDAQLLERDLAQLSAAP